MSFFGGGPPLGELGDEEFESLALNEPTIEEISLLHAIYSQYRTRTFSFTSRANKALGWDLVEAGLLSYVGAPRGYDEFRITRRGIAAIRYFGYRSRSRRLPGLPLNDPNNPFLRGIKPD
jgi:hypothetical protein